MKKFRESKVFSIMCEVILMIIEKTNLLKILNQIDMNVLIVKLFLIERRSVSVDQIDSF